MTLLDLTNHEAGIIIYENRHSVAAVNWGTIGDDLYPILSPIGSMMSWPMEDGWKSRVQRSHVDDFRTILPGSVWSTGKKDSEGNPIADTDLDIVYDPFGDFVRAFLDPDYIDGDFSASVYSFDGITVIAPFMWS